MALNLVPITIDDIPTTVSIYTNAFCHPENKVNSAMMPKGNTVAAMSHIIASDMEQFKASNYGDGFLVVDKLINEPIGFAKWKMKHGTPRPEDAGPLPPAPDSNMDAKAAFFGMADDAQEQAMGNKTYLHLSILATKQGHQRRGAGKLALEWGINKADIEGLDIFLTASPEGKGLYEQYGFRAVAEYRLDLRQFGVDAVHTSVAMLRMPQQRATKHM